MNFNFTNKTSKEEVFSSVQNFLQEKEYKIANVDQNRPWGGFFVIDEKQSEKFKKEFFGNMTSSAPLGARVSPKILIVENNKRLSWQYHHRRSELWTLIGGEAGIKRSENNTEGNLEILNPNEPISLKKGERHRLIGLNSWGIIAEIWQHTNPNHLSDEEDIVRVQDDFGR